jgi:diaminohydroxyphosphoribosylaminopyrimidine deaminase/5-amino-6-(5-phosphoribosylamino)uracil reductase
MPASALRRCSSSADFTAEHMSEHNRTVMSNTKHPELCFDPLLHPFYCRNQAVQALKSQGLTTVILGKAPVHPSASQGLAEETLLACLAANEALVHRAVLRRPLGILKYAMTLDGKIATAMGHSAWVSSSQSRARVFEQRAWSDAVIVGGNTVRR